MWLCMRCDRLCVVVKQGLKKSRFILCYGLDCYVVDYHVVIIISLDRYRCEREARSRDQMMAWNGYLHPSYFKYVNNLTVVYMSNLSTIGTTLKSIQHRQKQNTKRQFIRIYHRTV